MYSKNVVALPPLQKPTHSEPQHNHVGVHALLSSQEVEFGFRGGTDGIFGFKPAYKVAKYYSMGTFDGQLQFRVLN